MISVIGTRRLFILGVLLAVNAALAAALYLYIMPESEKLSRELRTAKAEISSKQAETDKLRTEYDLIQKQRATFEDLKEAGFLGPQDRVVARERMEAIQSHSRVVRANYSIEPVKVEENKFAADSGQVILNSVINADVDALDDVDFLSFVYWLENGFPGQITINNIDVKRENDVDDVTLRQIGTGSPLVIVKGQASFEWRTMVPREEAGRNMSGGM